MSDAPAVGIPTAIDLATGTRYRPDSIDQDPQPFDEDHLFCGGCTTPVHAARSTTQRRGKKTVGVPAHFQLTDPATSPHDPGCPYDWDARTDLLIAQSNGLLTRDKKGLTLQLPATTAADASADVLATTASTIELLDCFDEPDLAKQFHATYHDTTIEWDDYLHDLATDDTREALRRLHANLDANHPMAVAGIVHRVAQARNRQAYLDLHIETPVRNPDRSAWLHVRIISRTLDFDDYQAGDLVLAYGTWSTYLAPKSTNEWISLWTDNPDAVTPIVIADPPGTPAPATPTSDQIAAALDKIKEHDVAMELLHLPHDVRQRLHTQATARNMTIGQLITAMTNTYFPQ